MNAALIQNLRIASQRIIDGGFISYESKFGRISIDKVRNSLEETFLELLLAIFTRVEDNEEISVLPLKQILLELVFESGFEVDFISSLTTNVFNETYKYIESQPNYDSYFVRTLKTYESLIKDSIKDPNFFGSSTITDVLQEISSYQYSSTNYSFTPKDVDEKTNQIYTLFTKERYWEVFNGLTNDTSYSPLSYNRFVKSSGFPQYQISINYDDLVIYNNKLYKLKPGTSSPNRQQFQPDEWLEYSPRRFDKSKSFVKSYKEKIDLLSQEFLSNVLDINEIISDSYIITYPTTKEINPDQLTSTFGGEGKLFYQLIREFATISNAFGGYEGSPVGSTEYITAYMEYVLACAFGRKTSRLDNQLFGKFNSIFLSKTFPDNIPGLKFLDGFSKLKCFAHRQVLGDYIAVRDKQKINYNPVYSQFVDGLTDRYLSTIETTNLYSEPPRVDLLLYAIETLYKRSLAIGDSVQAILNSTDKEGRLIGYEGLGSVEIQMRHLQAIFPPTTYFLEQQSKITAGLTGSIKYLLDNYSKLSRLLVYPKLPLDPINFFSEWINLIYNKMEELVLLFKKIGIAEKTFIPNISFKKFNEKNTKVFSFLYSLGFRDSEINSLLDVESFEDLVTRFAPLSNSSDLKSFFKAYELSQLIYEFGGDAGISAYLSFLYSKSSVDSLINILDISQIDKSKATNFQINKYPKLIGLLIGLTYAINPQELIKFNNILGENNLTLLESIEFLYQSGQSSIIKNKEEIELLGTVIEQIIGGNYVDGLVSPDLNYEQVNKLAPLALKQWTEIIGDNLGKLDSKEIIKHLYDRSIGLTPKELISILDFPESVNPLGTFIDGFAGGEFTSFLRYANLSGLAIKLGVYKNSYQIDNFEVDLNSTYFTLPLLIETLESTIEITKLTETVIRGSIKPTNNRYKVNTDFLNLITFAQNKVYDIFPKILETFAKRSDQNTTLIDFGEVLNEAKDAQIQESPGIGNSRLPNRLAVPNSITSEQASILLGLESISSISQLEEQSGVSYSNLINKFIKFSDINKLINGVNLTNETEQIREARFRPKSFIPGTSFEVVESVKFLPGKEYIVPTLYRSTTLDTEVKSAGLGSNYISQREVFAPSVLKYFDPVRSCERFGGSDCASLYESSTERCIKSFNKSLFPETYLQVPGVLSSTAVIDRPLGTFARYVPQEVIIPTSSFKSPSQVYALLPEEAVPGERGEPILLVSKVYRPFVFSTGNGATSEYGNTEFSLVEFIRAKLEKNTEFNCATFESPFQYQICMNIMKCKRFIPPDQGEYYLDFCPRTLSGGRLK